MKFNLFKKNQEMTTVTNKNITEVLTGAECYTANLSELAAKLNKEIEFIENPKTGEAQIKLDFKSGMELVQIIYDQVKETALECEGMKISSLQGGAAYRRKAQEVFGTDSYRTEVMPQVRAEMAGSYVLRYGSEIVVVNLDQNGQARDAENTLYFTHAPLSSTWSVVIDRQNGNERIEIFKVRGDLWVGDGSKGRFILRRRR